MSREASHLTTGQLAYKSGVAERTLQRAEGGEPIREENLQCICQCLGYAVEVVRIDFENPPEHVKEVLAQGAALQPLKAQRILTPLEVNGLSGMLSILHMDERLSPEAQDLAVEIQQAIKDMIDIFMEGEPADRWQEAKRIAGLLDDLDQAGAALLAGKETVHLKPTRHAPIPEPVGLMVFAFLPNKELPPSLVYDRRCLPAMVAEHVGA
jgi:transcriptional regulator with XRE-family HTH domain